MARTPSRLGLVQLGTHPNITLGVYAARRRLRELQVPQPKTCLVMLMFVNVHVPFAPICL